MTGCNTRRLLIDLETYSSEDITKTGVHRYVQPDDFEILLLAYAWDEDPVRVIDLFDPEQNDELMEIVDALRDPEVIKVAHNAAFERAALGRWMDKYMPPEEWEDTMILAAYNGLPLSLDACGAALQLKDQKIKEGTSLISYFCKPCKPTIANGGRTRNLPHHAPDKWERFKAYCKRDVEVEQAIYYRLKPGYHVTYDEERLRWLDARINERGVAIDLDLVSAALEVDEAFTTTHTEELRTLTNLQNPNSVSRLKTWLEGVGLTVDSLNKGTVKDLQREATDPVTRRVLELRALLGKTSTKKYQAMMNAVCKDGRVRGLLQYYGAGRTGRWAGRLVQLQNLPQNHLDDIGEVREVIRSRDLDTIEMMFDSVPDTLSQLIRTAFVSRPGHTFLVADYSAIEARVIAYLAGEKWRMETFAQGGDIYCSSASQMFHVPVIKGGINGHLRQKGKVAELACGYGGGVGALKAFGADKMGLTEEEMQNIVTQWRAASPTIPKFWRDAETAAVRALERPGTPFKLPCGVAYRKDADALRCRLPSGRVLSYWGAGLTDDGQMYFQGQNQTTKNGSMSRPGAANSLRTSSRPTPVTVWARLCFASTRQDIRSVSMSTTRSSPRPPTAAAGRIWRRS